MNCPRCNLKLRTVTNETTNETYKVGIIRRKTKHYQSKLIIQVCDGCYYEKSWYLTLMNKVWTSIFFPLKTEDEILK